MFSKILQISLLILVISACVSCIAYKYGTPYQKFIHENHEEIVSSKEMDCFSCHKVEETDDPAERLALLGESIALPDEEKYVSGKCHECHREPETKVAKAPTKCQTCHTAIKTIMPASHTGSWVGEHTIPTLQAASDCARCHEQWFCVNCHNERDMGQQKPHPKTFKMAHIAAANADPAMCSSCHPSGFCMDCHATGR